MTETRIAPEITKASRIVPKSDKEDQRARFTRAMCRLLDDSGLLPERYELLDGVIYTRMPIYAPHRIVVILLRNWLEIIPGALYVQTENAIVVPGEDGETSEPQPDVAVILQPTTAYDPDNPPASEVRFIVEIADSTLYRDLSVKAGIYARAGIPEYWVFDIAGRQVHRHRVPTNGRYKDFVILSEDQTLTVPGREEAIRISDLLPLRREA